MLDFHIILLLCLKDIFCSVQYNCFFKHCFCTWFSELCALLVRCKHSCKDSTLAVYSAPLLRRTRLCNLSLQFLSVRHALGTRLLQKCLRHSPPGVVCTQVWNLKELTEAHHKNAWSMWLNLTQRGKSYRVRTHWGLTGVSKVKVNLSFGSFLHFTLHFKYASPFMIVW